MGGGFGLVFFKPQKQNHGHATGGRKPTFWGDIDQEIQRTLPEGNSVEQFSHRNDLYEEEALQRRMSWLEVVPLRVRKSLP